MRTETVCFVVTGEFLTEHARSLWAERYPDRAVSLLSDGLQGIKLGQVMSVLTGGSKLVGDSSAGIDIVEDSATTSSHGLPLPSLTNMFQKMQERSEIAERDVADLIALESGNTTSLGSPTGLRRVSQQTARELKSGEVTWDDVRIYQQVGSLLPLTDKPRVLKSDPPPPPPPPLKPHRKIVTDTGWLSPDGKFYPCGWQEHISMAGRIQRERKENEPTIGGHEYRLEKLGWLKLAGSNGIFEGERKPTKRQKKMVLEWCMGEGKGLTPLPSWLKPGSE